MSDLNPLGHVGFVFEHLEKDNSPQPYENNIFIKK